MLLIKKTKNLLKNHLITFTKSNDRFGFKWCAYKILTMLWQGYDVDIAILLISKLFFDVV